MGVILSGILGGFSGKVGPVVGGKWKDIDYMRSYVVPANPNTPSQQTVRGKFGALVSFAKKILPTVLQIFWDPFLSGMSGFNAFIKENYSKLQAGNVLDHTAVLSKGTLEPTSLCTSTYSTVNGTVSAVWDKTLVGNGLLTDGVALVVYERTSGRFWVRKASETRNSANIQTTLPTGYTATNIYAFLIFFRGTGSAFMVSNSTGDQCAAAPE